MSHTIRDKQKLKARASKIQGQVVALKKMLDEPHECAAVLQQIAASRGAVNGLIREVIKGHLREHVVDQGDELRREEDQDVVLKVLNSYIKSFINSIVKLPFFLVYNACTGYYHPPLRFIIATKRLGVPFCVKAEKYPYHLIWIMPA